MRSTNSRRLYFTNDFSNDIPRAKGAATSSEVILPEELYSADEVLGILAGAMEALKTPGLSKTEAMSQGVLTFVQPTRLTATY